MSWEDRQGASAMQSPCMDEVMARRSIVAALLSCEHVKCFAFELAGQKTKRRNSPVRSLLHYTAFPQTPYCEGKIRSRSFLPGQLIRKALFVVYQTGTQSGFLLDDSRGGHGHGHGHNSGHSHSMFILGGPAVMCTCAPNIHVHYTYCA
jgi:hypothetical protein